MIYKVEFLPRARRELLEAWDWYDDRWRGLGDRFLGEVEKRLQQIEKKPEGYAERRKGFRETKVKVFPFLIIYKIHKRKKLIAIISVFHTSKNPKKKYTKGQ